MEKNEVWIVILHQWSSAEVCGLFGSEEGACLYLSMQTNPNNYYFEKHTVCSTQIIAERAAAWQAEQKKVQKVANRKKTKRLRSKISKLQDEIDMIDKSSE